MKLPDVVEQRIEQALKEPKLQPTGIERIERIERFSDAEDRYVIHLLSALPHRLNGLHGVLYGANGAASGVSPQTLVDAGAEVTGTSAEPDGVNNGDGSTHVDNPASAVTRLGTDLGTAHDGDADRCLAVDDAGNLDDEIR